MNLHAPELQRPEVVMDDPIQLQDLYDFYACFVPNPRIAKIGYGVMKRVFRNDISFSPSPDDAEGIAVEYDDGTRQQIGEHLANGGQFMFVCNHQEIRPFPTWQPKMKTSFEQYVMAAAVLQVEELAPVAADTYIWSKAELSQRTNASRWFIDGMGQIPVFRKSDTLDPETGEPDPKKVQLLKIATDLLIEASIARHNRGGHGALLPEGKRAPFDNPTILPLKGGIGLILSRIDREINMKVVSMAIDYGPEKKIANFKPRLHINRPIQFDYSIPSRTVDFVHDDLQSALDSVRSRRP